MYRFVTFRLGEFFLKKHFIVGNKVVAGLKFYLCFLPFNEIKFVEKIITVLAPVL